MSTYAFDDIRDDLAKFAESVNRQSDAASRLLLAHNGELAKLWDEIAALRDAFLEDVRALSHRIEALSTHMHGYVDAQSLSERNAFATHADLDVTLKDYALQNDLDSLRSEMHAAIAEATATPFDPERPTA